MNARRRAAAPGPVRTGRAPGPGPAKPRGRRAPLSNQSRFSLLCEVSQILAASGPHAFATVSAIVRVLSREMPLRTGVLVLDSRAGPHVRSWPGDGTSQDDLRRARRRARRLYEFLVGRTDEWLDDGHPGIFVLLPLVGPGARIVGALQVEGAGPLVEDDLAVVNAVVNQLSADIGHRAAVWTTRATERAKRRSAEELAAGVALDLGRARFFSEASSVLASSIDYRATIARVAQLAVPFLADACIVDLVERGSRDRVAAETAPGEPAGLPDLVQHALVPVVMGTGMPVLVRDARQAPRGLSGADEFVAMRRVGVVSVMGVPLTCPEGTLGVLTLANCGSGRTFHRAELGVAEELARRVALSVANSKLHQRAERAIRQRQDVLAMVSHDLRSPLNAILFVVQFLLRLPAEKDRRKDDRAKLEIVRRSVMRMDRMIQDLLDFSSIEAGHLALDIGHTDLASVLRYAVDPLLPAAEARGLRLLLEPPPEATVVSCDGARIIQVLSNLVGNAIKFTPSEGTVVVRAELERDRAVVRVTDTGPGIEPDRLPHVFERYWQASETAAKGTGLGLFISKGIIDAHGERIGVESRAGAGASFFFTLSRPAGSSADRPA